MTEQTTGPWLSIIGIGEDGVDGLNDLAWSLIAGARTIIGGERHLAMLPDDLIESSELVSWPSPFSDIYPCLEQLRGQEVVILASGDPMHFGIGGTLSRHFARSEMRILSSSSSFSLAASRLGWPMDKCEMLTIHGRDPDALQAHFLPGAKLLILSKDGSSPVHVAKQLCARGWDRTQVIVLEHLGGDAEKIIETDAGALCAGEQDLCFADLNLLAIALPDQIAGWLPTVPGLPDDAFEHDGKMTKRDVRASALAKLAPHPNALLWDIGVGCGSVAIEWLRTHPSCRAIGIEALERRRAFARHNAERLGVPQLCLLAGIAPDGLMDAEAPDAAFIGGGLSENVIEFCLEKLKPGGRLVAHAVTLSSERLLQECFEHHGGELTRLSIAKAIPVGVFHGWKPAMPVTQWAFGKKF